MQFIKCTKKEHLSTIFVEPVLNARLSELNSLLNIKLKEIHKAPSGSLRITQSNHVTQYYHRDNPKDTCGQYIPVKNLKLAKQLAQKDYDKKLIISLKKELKILEKTLNEYRSLSKKIPLAEKLLEKFHLSRQKLITPVRLSDEEFIKNWQNVMYEKKEIPSDIPEHLTASNEQVRSKSECIIADTLKRMNIPYHYEYPIRIISEYGETKIFHPDFICLNIRTRQEFIWEHLGIMDNSEYATAAIRKLKLFEKNGIFPGKNLILSTETANLPINTKQIEKIAIQYLK